MSYSSTSSSASESDPGTSVPARDYANLRDMTAFPTFFDIPELMIQVANGKVYKPHEHWCLLVEIFAIESFSRLVLRCKDKADKLVIIAFYTEDEGRAFDTSELHCGQTVAIMYPTQHQFLDGRWGVRQEDYRSIKLFPTSLDNLLRLSDEVRSWPKGFGKHTECHGCGQSNVPLSTCARCKVMRYCSRECQRVGWQDKGHSQTCKIVADRDFQKMMTTDWVRFRGFKKFLFRRH